MDTTYNLIYTFGYSGSKWEYLKHYVETLDALLVDVRFSLKSRDPKWSGKQVRELLGDRYRHVKELGNRNYRGGPIDLVDPQAAANILEPVLRQQPIILMCVCLSWETCHRTAAAAALADAYGLPRSSIIYLPSKPENYIAPHEQLTLL